MATNLVEIENDAEIKARLTAERVRLRRIAGVDQPTHFPRPVETAFTAEQRKHVTILFGGFTWKHEDLIRAVFQGCGYRCEKVPLPTVAGSQTGKEFGNNGQCNPTYFTVGNLVQYLQFLVKEGLTREQIPVVRAADRRGDGCRFRSPSVIAPASSCWDARIITSLGLNHEILGEFQKLRHRSFRRTRSLSMTIQKIEIQLAALEAELRNQKADFRPAICPHTVESMEER